MFHTLLGHIRRQPVAFVALFFALGGGAMAASQVMHVGDPAGGDLTGTYPNPTIATGKVISADFASGAQAPDAALLAGAGPSDYGAVLSGRINGLNTSFGSDYGVPSGTSSASGTEADASTLSPSHGLVARDLSIQLTVAPGTTFGRIFYLFVNGAPTALHCEIDTTATTCTASGPVTVPANSTLSIADRVPSPAYSPAAADARFAFRLTNS